MPVPIDYKDPRYAESAGAGRQLGRLRQERPRDRHHRPA